MVLDSGFYVFPSANINWSGCAPDGLSLNGIGGDHQLTHYWDIAGIESSTISNPVITSITPDQNYQVNYTVTDMYGNMSSTSQNVYYGTCPGPAEFGWNGCFEEGITVFNDNNDGTIINKMWKIGRAHV